MSPSEAAIELRWYFTESEGELGLRAASLEPGTGDADPERAASRRTAAYLREADVIRRIHAVGGASARVLRVAYTPYRWMGLERWYELAGVGALLLDREDIIAAGKRVAKLPTAEATALRARAKTALRSSLRAFVEAR